LLAAKDLEIKNLEMVELLAAVDINPNRWSSKNPAFLARFGPCDVRPNRRKTSPLLEPRARAARGLSFLAAVSPPTASTSVTHTNRNYRLLRQIAGVALLVRHIHGMAVFSPMILAIVIGMAFRNIVGTPSLARPGIAFSLRRLLRAAIVLLGFQLTASQIASVGPRGLLIVAMSLATTFGFTVWTGRALGVGRKLTELIAAGTSICGASAIIATNTVTEAHDDVAYAIACVTVFGSIAMFAYPLLPGLLHLDSRAYGLWSGASIHEIAQVVAAAFQNGQRAGEIGTMVKLSRVMLLAPVVFALSLKSRISAVALREKPQHRPSRGSSSASLRLSE
jgi:uncharacterized integral membrane protein (TIGR00698 family)